MDYPQKVFIQVSGPTSDEFLSASEDITNNSFEDGKIAVYEFKDILDRQTTVLAVESADVSEKVME